MKPFSGAVAFLSALLIVRNTTADLSIELRSINESFKSYSDLQLFRIQYANIPSNFQGLLHQPYPGDGCDYIQPLPDSTLNYSWIAVIRNYSTCVEEMVDNVRNAGYKLILTYSDDDAHMNVNNYVINSGFGVAVVSNHYADTLRKHLVPDVNGTFTDTTVVATIDTAAVATPATITTLFLTVCFCCGWAVCCCVLCCRGRQNNDYTRQVAEIEGRRRNFERLQRQDRLARQELIESILRQLQELQVDVRSQIPLGADETRKLPIRKFREGEEKIERCAICVDDFKDGDMLRVLPCEHAFHRECIDEWLVNHSAVCPLCKFEVPRGNVNQPTQPRGRAPDLSEQHSTSLSSYEEDSPLLLPRNSTRHESSIRLQYGSV